MSGCEYYEELISRKLDEALSVEEEAALADHLKNCPDCARMALAFAALSQNLSEDLVEAPESLCVNVMAELRRAEIRKNNPRKHKRIFRMAMTAAACTVLLLAGSALLRPSVLTGGSAADSAAAENMAENGILLMMEEAAPREAAPADAPAAAERKSRASGGSASDGGPALVTEAAFDPPMLFALQTADMPQEQIPDWESLRDFLAGSPVSEIPELGEADLVLPILLMDSEAELCVYAAESGLYYTDPEQQILMESSCTLEQLQQKVQK